MNQRKFASVASIASVAAVAAMLMGVATEASAGGKRLGKPRCFGDTSLSTCVTNRDSVNLTVYSGGYAGVYLNRKASKRNLLSEINYSFTANGTVGGGAPRFSIPVNKEGGTTIDAYAFMDAAGCGGVANTPVVVSTSSATCRVFFDGVDYDNWAELAADFPRARVALGGVPFIISDVPGTYSVYNIDLR